MTRFLDGPAAGVVLMLRRAPLFLRVVHHAKRKEPWDALDQLADVPGEHEELFAYERVAKPTFMHLKCSGKGAKGASGFYAMAEYRLVAEQPAETVMRDTKAWRGWCWVRRGDHESTRS